MVSCVESLLSFIELHNDKLGVKIEEIILLNEKFSNQEKEEVKNWLKNRKIKKKFIEFIKIYSSGFFRGGNRKAKHCYIKKKDLINYLGRIYDARSYYIHEGKPMYISSDLRMQVGEKCYLWDISPDLGIYADKRKILGGEKLPRVRWFERIVNYSLKNFIKKIATKNI